MTTATGDIVAMMVISKKRKAQPSTDFENDTKFLRKDAPHFLSHFQDSNAVKYKVGDKRSLKVGHTSSATVTSIVID